VIRGWGPIYYGLSTPPPASTTTKWQHQCWPHVGRHHLRLTCDVGRSILISPTGEASSAVLSDSPSSDGKSVGFTRQAVEGIRNIPHFRDTRHGPPRRPRAQHAPRCYRQAYDCSIPVTHTRQRRGRCNYSSWHTTPSLAGKRRGWQGSPRRNIYRASTSGVDGYHFAPAEHTWTRNWNRRRFCVFQRTMIR
jgi:hypothetical protein